MQNGELTMQIALPGRGSDFSLSGFAVSVWHLKLRGWPPVGRVCIVGLAFEIAGQEPSPAARWPVLHRRF
jgi:hypothetical protein